MLLGQRSKGKSKSITASVLSRGSKQKSDIGAGKEDRADLHKKQKGKVNLGGAKIGFVGAGKMTDALVKGLISYGKLRHLRLTTLLTFLR